MRKKIYVKTDQEALEILAGLQEDYSAGTVHCDCGETPGFFAESVVIAICEHCSEVNKWEL